MAAAKKKASPSKANAKANLGSAAHRSARPANLHSPSYATAFGSQDSGQASSTARHPPTWRRSLPRLHRVGAIVGGVGAFSVGIWAAYTFAAVQHRQVPDPTNSPSPAVLDQQQPDRRSVFDQIASQYDRDISWDEFLMGLLLVRRWMVSKAEGDVLEIAAGTGRNLPYYRKSKVTSLTLTDASAPMLAQAAKQGSAEAEGTGTTDTDGASALDAVRTRAGLRFRAVAADAEHLPFANNSFDTVVSTFSLCSVHRPVAAVGEALRVLRPGGTLLLVEHGLGHYAWLNRLLHANSTAHASRWGCYFDRDIGQIVGEACLGSASSVSHASIPTTTAASSTVDKEGACSIYKHCGHIESISRLHFGTTWLIVITKV